MPSTDTFISVYDQRVALVADALRKNSKLNKETSVDLAAHVLRAIDLIPEKLR